MKTLADMNLSLMDRAIVGKIHSAIEAALPGATVILFGSRARGDAAEDSDWDVLALTDRPVTQEMEESAHSSLFRVELDEDVIIGLLLISRFEWEQSRYKNHPIRRRVEEEGALIA